METPPNNKEQIPEFDIKISIDSTESQVKQKYLNGGLIKFMGTDSLNLYLSAVGHDELRFGHDIKWQDIITRGYVQLKNGKLKISHYERLEPNIMESNDRALTAFFGNLG